MLRLLRILASILSKAPKPRLNSRKAKQLKLLTWVFLCSLLVGCSFEKFNFSAEKGRLTPRNSELDALPLTEVTP